MVKYLNPVKTSRYIYYREKNNSEFRENLEDICFQVDLDHGSSNGSWIDDWIHYPNLLSLTGNHEKTIIQNLLKILEAYFLVSDSRNGSWLFLHKITPVSEKVKLFHEQDSLSI